MAERLTMKVLAEDIEALRNQVKKLEERLDRKLKSKLEKAVEKLQSRITTLSTSDGTMSAHGAGIDSEERQRLIAEAAYMRAAQRGFEGGDPEQDWIDAEDEINEHLMQANRSEATTSTGRMRSRKS